jgi:hypothetical protein
MQPSCGYNLDPASKDFLFRISRSFCSFHRRCLDNLSQNPFEPPIFSSLCDVRLFFHGLVALDRLAVFGHHPTSWQVRRFQVRRFPVTDPNTCWKRSPSVRLRSFVAKRFFIEVTKQMERLDTHVGSLDGSLQQAPEIF